jgi:hypothetical protein
VPAGGRASATLPVFVDERTALPGAYALAATASVLGSREAQWTARTPLYVRQGSTTAAAGVLAGFATSALGYAWIARRLRGWLERAATSELMTIALFGAVLFGVGTASDVLSMAVGAVLGPFATLVTGLLQDVLRVALLGTLLTLLPRPGTLALAILTGGLGRALTTGGFTPTDILYYGASVSLAEGFAWIAFAGANALTTLLGLWLHTVLFRLYFADWYLWLQVLGPGFLYVLVACALAVPFADSLRRVEA